MPRERITWTDRLVYRVTELFLEGMPVKDIADTVNSDSPENLNREQVYPILRESVKRGFLELLPRLESELRDAIAKRFGLNNECIDVVYTTSRIANAKVAEHAARRVLQLITQLGDSKRKPIGLGLGPGRATLDLCRYLSRLLETARLPQKIRLHAITAGCPISQPEYAPLSFFNLFPERVFPEDGGERRVGLFSETMVSSEEFERLKTRPGSFREAYRRRDDIDVIVSSMGMITDPHDLYQSFLQEYDVKAPKGILGNVQYRPFTALAPIRERDKDFRAVTLFDLDDFRRLSQTKGKHVILIARQCGACGLSRAAALSPLLTKPELKVWSDLVIDVESANDLMIDRDAATS